MNHEDKANRAPLSSDETRSNHKEDEAVSFAWQLEDRDVQPLPQIYPQINPLILKDTPVNVVAKRLSRFMRINSVRSTYDTEKARAIGCTPSVSFVVQFWKPRNCSHNSKDEIWLEVTRRRGCCIVLHKIRNALAQSLNSDQDPVRYESLLSNCHRLKPSPRIKAVCTASLERSRFHPTNQQIQLQRKDLESSLNLLESNSYDKQDLGMENIAFMSDETKVPRDEALTTARLLIFRQSSLSGEPSNDDARLQNAVEDYVYEVEEVRPRASEERQFHFILTAISNSAEMILQDHCPEMISSCIHVASPMLCVYWRHMMEFFLRRLVGFRRHPESAALAAKCIRLLSRLAEHSEIAADEMHSRCETLPPLLHEACQFGKSHNALLECEASNLRQTVSRLH
jgi:hypothetical protein